MKIDDRRVRKTKKALREALVKLMKNKELRSITVKELTDTADIHRATFYVHYQDVYDLYEQLEDGVVRDIDEIVKKNPMRSYEDIYIDLIEYVYDNVAICKMFLGKNSNRNFQNRISKTLVDNYLKIWIYEDGINEVSTEMIYLTKYHIEGCLSIISNWVEDDFSYPKKNIIQLIQKVDLATEQIMC